MTPTEHELTVATEALARYVHDTAAHQAAAMLPGMTVPTWDTLTPLERHPRLEQALVYVVPILDALPDRLDPVRAAYARAELTDDGGLEELLA